MSHIPTALYLSPCPVADAALDEARRIVDAWIDYDAGSREALACEVSGWVAVDLGERIARAILEAKGYDVDALEDELDAVELARDGRTQADVVGEWARRDGR